MERNKCNKKYVCVQNYYKVSERKALLHLKRTDTSIQSVICLKSRGKEQDRKIIVITFQF